MMRLSERLNAVLEAANEYTAENNYSLITPETILLMMCEDEVFCRAFVDCGGKVNELVQDLTDYCEEYIDKTTDEEYDPEISAGLSYLITYAGEHAISSGRGEIDVRHIINGLWAVPECYAVYFMEKQGVDRSALLRAISEYDDNGSDDGTNTGDPGAASAYAGRTSSDEADQGDILKMYAPCLNEMLDGVNPLIGREEELERTIQVLCRKDKNNPLHIGDLHHHKSNSCRK